MTIAAKHDPVADDQDGERERRDKPQQLKNEGEAERVANEQGPMGLVSRGNCASDEPADGAACQHKTPVASAVEMLLGNDRTQDKQSGERKVGDDV